MPSIADRKAPARPTGTFSQRERVLLSHTVARTLLHGNWACPPDELGEDFTAGLLISPLPLDGSGRYLLVEAGAGCARGGQGANGAMWVVRLTGSTAEVLSDTNFSGWLYSVQDHRSHGLRDLVVGWHMGAAETGLSYFRFDGRRYREVGTADETTAEDGSSRITPAPSRGSPNP